MGKLQRLRDYYIDKINKLDKYISRLPDSPPKIILHSEHNLKDIMADIFNFFNEIHSRYPSGRMHLAEDPPKGKYTKFFDEQYNDIKELYDEPTSKLEYISESIFDFTLYDNEVDEVFALKMLEILDIILTGKQLEYIGVSNENYRNYLTWVNMPFLAKRLDWGGSIRTAWFSYDEQTINGIIVPQWELNGFIEDLIEWSGYKTYPQNK